MYPSDQIAVDETLKQRRLDPDDIALTLTFLPEIFDQGIVLLHTRP